VGSDGAGIVGDEWDSFLDMGVVGKCRTGETSGCACQVYDPGPCTFVGADGEMCGDPCVRFGLGSRHSCRCFTHCRNRRGFLGIEKPNLKPLQQVDFACVQKWEIEATGNMLAVSTGTVETTDNTIVRSTGQQRRHWTQEAMQAEVTSTQHYQTLCNATMYAIEKARARAAGQQTSEPLAIEDLDEELLMPQTGLALTGSE